MWVRSKYASELAVLSAWLTMFIPWNIAAHDQVWERLSIQGEAIESSIYFLRFPLFEIQFRSGTVVKEINGRPIGQDISSIEANTYAGTNLFGDVFLATPPQSVTFYDSTLQQASILWTLGSLAFFAAFALSLALYFREDRVTEALPISQVRLMGALLGIGALATAGASIMYFLERDLVGTPIPIGVIVIGALAAVLLQTEELPDEEEKDPESSDSDSDDAEAA
jgi:uncharacterized protein (TIGR04206 family)